MSINLNEQEMAAVLADVERDLEEVLKAESETLRKDFPPKEDEGSSPAPDASPEASESAPAEGSEGAPPEASDAPPADASPAPDAGSPPPAEGAPGAEGAGMEEDLESKLGQLPEEQLRHLYMAAKQALFARMSQAGAPDAGGSPAPDASAGGMPPPAPEALPMAMKNDAGLGMMKPSAKGEMSSSKANGGPGPGAVKLGKSEAELKVTDLEAKVEVMAKALNLLIGQPMRKAVTSIAHLPKNDGSNDVETPNLSKAEVTAKLKNLDQAKLSKSDRTAINQYYTKFDVATITHLLK